jgi:hypothetical protein
MPADVQLNETNNADSGTEIQINPGFSGNNYVFQANATTVNNQSLDIHGLSGLGNGNGGAGLNAVGGASGPGILSTGGPSSDPSTVRGGTGIRGTGSDGGDGVVGSGGRANGNFGAGVGVIGNGGDGTDSFGVVGQSGTFRSRGVGVLGTVFDANSLGYGVVGMDNDRNHLTLQLRFPGVRGFGNSLMCSPPE